MFCFDQGADVTSQQYCSMKKWHSFTKFVQENAGHLAIPDTFALKLSLARLGLNTSKMKF